MEHSPPGNDYSAGSETDIIEAVEKNPQAFLEFMDETLDTLDSGNDYMDKELAVAIDECTWLVEPEFTDMKTGDVASCNREEKQSDSCKPDRHRYRSSCGVCNNLQNRLN